MKFTQHVIRFMSRLMLAAGMFLQVTLAAHACVSSVQRVDMLNTTDVAVETMPCHVAEKVNTNACFLHCSQDSQINLDQHTMTAVPVNAGILYVKTPEAQSPLQPFAANPLVLNTDPPLRIRFCSFLV